MTEWNNNYKYKYNIMYGDLYNEENTINQPNQILIILTYLLNKHLGLEGTNSLQLYYHNNSNCNIRFVCKLYDEYINEYGKTKLRLIVNPKEILFWLNEFECDISGFKIEKLDDTKFLCIKSRYINTILKKCSDQDIEEAFKQIDLLSKIEKYLSPLRKKGFKSCIQVFSNLDNTHFAFDLNGIKGLRNELKEMLKNINIDFYITGKSQSWIFSDVNIYKVNDFYFTDALLRMKNC